MADGRDGARGSSVIFIALLGLALLLRIGFAAHGVVDPDESQHLHAAWLVGEGQVPYRDFWEHHSPLFYYLLAPLTRGLAEGPGVYFAGRALMAGTAAVALLLLSRLAGRLQVAMAATVLLALQPSFLENTSEVRPDVPALVTWLAAVLAVVVWRERGGSRWLWAAGVAVGMAGTLTTKAVFGLGGLAVAVLAGAMANGWGRAARAVTVLALGSAVPVLGMLAGLWLAGGAAALAGFVQHVLVDSLRFADFSRAAPLATSEVGFGLVAVAGIALVIRREGRAAIRHPVHGPLLVAPAVVAVALLLPVTPAVYAHAWLPIQASLAVYAALALAALARRVDVERRRAPAVLAVMAVATGLVVPAAASGRLALRDANSPQLRIMRHQLRHACPGEPVLDGTGLYVFRPAAYRYRTLINGIRFWVAEGIVSEEAIVEDVRRAGARVAYADRRVRAMIGPLAAFLARHYVASPDGVLVAGARVTVPGDPGGGRAYVELLVSGPYRLAASPGITVAIDQAAAQPGIVRLDGGRHELTWSGPPGTIGLTGLSCVERRALDQIP